MLIQTKQHQFKRSSPVYNVIYNDVIISSFFLLSPKTVTLVRPGAEMSQAAQRLMSNPLSSSAVATTPLSSLPSPLPSAPLRTPVPHTLSPASHSKLAAANGTAALKLPTLSQGSATSSTQESSQDKQAEQAKLVRPFEIFTVHSSPVIGLRA